MSVVERTPWDGASIADAGVFNRGTGAVEHLTGTKTTVHGGDK